MMGLNIVHQAADGHCSVIDVHAGSSIPGGSRSSIPGSSRSSIPCLDRFRHMGRMQCCFRTEKAVTHTLSKLKMNKKKYSAI